MTVVELLEAVHRLADAIARDATTTGVEVLVDADGTDHCVEVHLSGGGRVRLWVEDMEGVVA